MMRQHTGLAIGLLLVTWTNAIGQSVVSPKGLAGRDGNDSFNAATASFRGQELHLASAFVDVLPEGGAFLTGMAARTDPSETRGPVVTLDFEHWKVTLSVTERETVSSNFAANVGPNPVTVFDGSHSFQYDTTTTPRPFGIPFLPFDPPFFYDPAEGNLLFEITTRTGADSVVVLDSESFGVPLSVYGDVDALSGTTFGFVSVQQFSFVPEPSSFLLAVSAFALLFLLRRR